MQSMDVIKLLKMREVLHSSVFSSCKATGVDVDIDPPIKECKILHVADGC